TERFGCPRRRSPARQAFRRPLFRPAKPRTDRERASRQSDAEPRGLGGLAIGVIGGGSVTALTFPIKGSRVFSAFARASIASKALMGTVWTFLRKSRNLQLVSLGVTVAVAIFGGIWAVMVYVWPPHEGPTAVCADQGVAIGGKVTGSTIDNRV